ncbi:DEAD/DEAH box helicase [Candidatus Berkelbacteria bacterium]|nr:DEAD/DEAH box helicase [Candidatus Berkelbacteria bacterium]
MAFRAYARPSSFRGRTSYGRPRFNRGTRPKHQSQYIDPARFVNRAVAPEADQVFVPTHRFADFKFLPGLERNLAARGYTLPTAIQDQAIPHILSGRDFIGLANTGTGKTAAFVLPLIHRLKTVSQGSTALVVAPTRELAQQINDEFRAFAQGLGLYSALCVGGTSMSRQIRDLSRRPQVVIGTPGRLRDLLARRVLQLDRVGYFILDEADRMLDMGFIRDIKLFIEHLPANRQSLALSATVTPQVSALMAELLRDPVTVSVRTGDTCRYVEQDVIEVSTPNEKFDALTTLMRKPGFSKVLIFGQMKHAVQKLADQLTRHGIPAGAIHGNKSQAQRQRALDAFKANKMVALVATDVAARGLDIPNVTHVINYDLPMTFDDYTHRIGRTGRAGNRGYALTFIAPRR